jgi:hypothetical protein
MMNISGMERKEQDWAKVKLGCHEISTDPQPTHKEL